MIKRGIILNVQQAEIFIAHAPAVDEVISFCPSATHRLQEKKYRVTSTASIYGAAAHAKVVKLVAHELPLVVDSATAQYGLSYPETEGLRVYLYHYLCCVYHLYFCLCDLNIPEAEFMWVEEKSVQSGAYDAMFATLSAQPTRAILSYAYTDYSVPHYVLAAMYNRVIVLLLSHSKRLKVIDYGDELPKRIVQAMIKNGENPLVINTHTVAKNAYKTTRFFIKSVVRILAGKADGMPVYVFRAHVPGAYKTSVAPFHMPALHAPEVHSITQTMVERFIPFVRAEVAMGRALIRHFRPEIAVSDHAKYAYILGGLEEMRGYGGQHAMLNHGTHTIQYDAVSQLAAKLWGEQQRMINRNTTHSLPKSPLTAALTREIRGDVVTEQGDARSGGVWGEDPQRATRKQCGYQICKINVYGKIENKAAREGKFVVLQAGNYTDAYNHIPWCKETADEYLLAILELIDECAKLPNVELIIKLKPKKSKAHQEIVQAHIDRLGVGDTVRVDTTSKFSEVMARAHIVVCNLSGTIEEALANNIPLMLHTYRKSYFHIAEQTVKDAAKGELAPCYLVKERSDIGRIITLLDTKRAELNDKSLYATVAWQENELTSINDFAKDLVQAARKQRGSYV